MTNHMSRSNSLFNVNPSNTINELYREAVTTGCAPANYCKVQILGDERVGKTSLRKNLMGEKFDPEQPSTVGIDTRMCNVKEVDEAWCEIDVAERREFSDIVSWFCSKAFWRDPQITQISKLENLLHSVFTIGFNLMFIYIIMTLVFVQEISLDCSLSSVMWVSCITLLVTKRVQLYLFLCRVAESIFIMNMIGYLYVNGLPRILWCCSCLLITLGADISVIIQTRTGRSVLLAVQLLSIGSINTDDRWQDHLSTDEEISSITGCIIGRQLLPRLEYFSRKLPIRVYAAEKLAQLSQISRDILAGSLLVTFSICFSMIFVHQHCAILFMGSLYSGVGFAIGLTLGDRLSVSPLFNVLIKHTWLSIPPQLLYGWIQVKLSGRDLPFQAGDYLKILQSGLIPLIIADMHRNHLLDYNQAAAKVTQQVLRKSKKEEKLPLNLSLWDFAGQELYYNTHHTFMSEHAVYIVVFSLKDFRETVTSTTHLKDEPVQRIKFWIDSVRQHANSSILLVGTHRDCINEEVVQKTQRYLKNSLHSYKNVILNNKSCFFAVDNSKDSASGTDDLDHLRRTIQSEARGVQRMSKEYPIRWRRFLEFLMQWRSEPAHPPYLTISELKEIAVKFYVHTTKELVEMLTFFHDNGEIIYDSVDSVLRQFVVLEPQVMIDIMEALVVVPPTSFDVGRFTNEWQQLERTGMLEHNLLDHIVLSKLSLASDDESHLSTEAIVGMLQAKDLICKVKRTDIRRTSAKWTGQPSNTSEEIYVVPSMLPSTKSLPPDTISWHKRLYIDFGHKLPSAVFLRLMSRCASYSDIVSLGQDQCQLFSDGGIFTLGTNYLFMLRKLQPCDNQYVVEVSIKAAHDWHPLEVLKYLCSILDTLRCRDFPGLQFTAGVLCPCDAPHQGCKDQEMMHILELHTEMETEETILHRWCNGRRIHTDVDELESPLTSTTTEDGQSEPITVNVQGVNNFVVVSGKQSRIVINRVQGYCKGKDSKEENDHPETSELGIDVYISCSPHDEGWIQETLVRYLTGPPHYIILCLNRYDVPTQAVHVRQQNAKQIEKSGVFLAVCSRYYRVDPTGRLTFEREVARRCGIPIIGINRDCAKSDLSDMFDVDEVSFSSSDREAMGSSLELLARRIVDIIRKQSNN